MEARILRPHDLLAPAVAVRSTGRAEGLGRRILAMGRTDGAGRSYDNGQPGIPLIPGGNRVVGDVGEFGWSIELQLVVGELDPAAPGPLAYTGRCGPLCAAGAFERPFLACFDCLLAVTLVFLWSRP